MGAPWTSDDDGWERADDDPVAESRARLRGALGFPERSMDSIEERRREPADAGEPSAPGASSASLAELAERVRQLQRDQHAIGDVISRTLSELQREVGEQRDRLEQLGLAVSSWGAVSDVLREEIVGMREQVGALPSADPTHPEVPLLESLRGEIAAVHEQLAALPAGDGTTRATPPPWAGMVLAELQRIRTLLATRLDEAS